MDNTATGRQKLMGTTYIYIFWVLYIAIKKHIHTCAAEAMVGVHVFKKSQDNIYGVGKTKILG